MNLRITARPLLVVGLVALVSGCALRLGGRAPEPLNTLALDVPAGATAASVAEQIRAAEAQVVLLSAQNAESDWFTQVAAQAGLVSSRPSTAGAARFAFLTQEAAIGDTTVMLAVVGGDSLRVHDALYKIDDRRNLDLIIFRLEPTMPLQPAMESLLLYIATDVGHNVSVALAIDAANPARADSAVRLLSPAFADVTECERAEDIEAAPPLDIRLMYGPEVRTGCDWARLPGTGGRAVLARLVIRR